MINHARTLLLNRRGGGQALTELGEEYIPETFAGQVLDNNLKHYWTLLFGSKPDNTWLNFQARRLLQIIHATSYEKYLFYHDKRITYAPNMACDFALQTYGFEQNTSSALRVVGAGELDADPKQGRMKWQWKITVTNGDVVIEELVSGNSYSGTIRNPASTVSYPFKLPAKELSEIVIQGPSTDVGDWNGVINLTGLGRPTDDISTVIYAIGNSSGHDMRLFGAGNKEPYRTFADLWSKKTLPEKTAGLVLALIFKLHESYINDAR